MYKELKKHIQKEESKTYSSEEVFHTIAERLVAKSASYTGFTEEELHKGMKNAFKTGLSVLGLIHGAHYIDSADTKKPAPRSVERSVSSMSRPSPKGSIKNNNIQNFLKAISMNESSGGKNMNHRTMNSGMHKGDTAHGMYGLMPNTARDIAGRLPRNHSLNRTYKNMPNDQIGPSLKANPGHEKELATHMATRLHGKFGGDESKMAYSWLNGSSLTNDHFKEGGGHSDYKNHSYVKKYHNNRQQNEKTPVKPAPAVTDVNI